jgi:hypothetical protein
MSTRIERAERRLRAAEALTADLRLAVEQERRLGIYTSTGSAQAQQEAANIEPSPQIGTAPPRAITARAAHAPNPAAACSADRPTAALPATRTAWSDAEAEPTRYARAKAAGLDDTIAALACGKEAV